MSRKDTIIIAVLVNAGLLVVLFASALKSNKEDGNIAQKSHYEMKRESKDMTPPLFANKHSSNDEVDQVLRQYSQPQAVSSAVATAAPRVESEPTAPFSANDTVAANSDAMTTPPKIEIPPSFAEEIRALSEAQSQGNVVAKAPEAPQSTSPSTKYIEVRVSKGDVLDKLARRYHVKVEEIMRINNLKTTNLSVGQILKVPATSAQERALATTPKKTAPVNSNGAKYYVVKPGDSPWSIATKNHIKVDDLLKLNNLTADEAKRLKPGRQLRVK